MVAVVPASEGEGAKGVSEVEGEECRGGRAGGRGVARSEGGRGGLGSVGREEVGRERKG